MNPNAQKDLLLTTDYPTDVFRLIEGSQSIPAGSTLGGSQGNYQFTIDTGLTDMLVGLPCYSFSSDFSDQFSTSFGDRATLVPTGGSINQPVGNVFACGADFSNTTILNPNSNLHIRVVCAVGTTTPARTLYYRFALLPVFNNTNIPHNSNLNESFVFSTDNNYLKLFSKGAALTVDPLVVSTGMNHKPTVIPFMYFNYAPDEYYGEILTYGLFFDDGVIQGYQNVAYSEDDGTVSIPSVGTQFAHYPGYRIYIDE